MTESMRTVIPARKGVAVRVARGETIRVINTHGTQVVDTWAFNSADIGECMSMEHSRACMNSTMPRVGDSLVTNKRRPILTVVGDTSGGIHDTLIAACDRYRYELLGVSNHDNCTANLAIAMAGLGFSVMKPPCPLNLFMNIPVKPDGTLSFEPPVSTAGSYILLRAEMDIVLAFSACPQDLVPINGRDCVPKDAHFEIGNSIET